MSFTSMHNDYLDPDKHLHHPYDDSDGDAYAGILEQLKNRDSGRWPWDEIDCCWTGKYADLDDHGQQGLHLDKVDEQFAYATAHLGLTVCGSEVTLNIPEAADRLVNGLYDGVLEAYLDSMEGTVVGSSLGGEYDGGDWYLAAREEFRAPLVLNAEGEVDCEATAEALISEGQQALKYAEEESVMVSRISSELAGWISIRKDGRVQRCKEGKPGRNSAYRLYLNPL
jgi:hypothetical protein